MFEHARKGGKKPGNHSQLSSLPRAWTHVQHLVSLSGPTSSTYQPNSPNNAVMPHSLKNVFWVATLRHAWVHVQAVLSVQ
eukprot:5807968-Amphidinium_carterae.1